MKNPLMLKKVVIISASVVIIGAFILFFKGNIIPVGIYHLIHLNKPPTDLYTPLVVDKFMFSEKGYSKTYKVSPKYKDIHEVGVLFQDEGLDSKYQFEGVLGIELLCGVNVVTEKNANSFQYSWFMDKEMKKINKASFETFSSLLCGTLEEIGVRVTVKKTDLLIEDSGKLYIAVSAVP